eukprot:TRINITY_DN76617_c0_g1_i1.p1 TRINITY_DN76617_c0_g1~~TRINITY_DN76617_c0_g1_i1.p1  ORF type:complete len:353 (-),score=59.76 TRINITY_DN76617_c0_g1_i1:148-1206(-)
MCPSLASATTGARSTGSLLEISPENGRGLRKTVRYLAINTNDAASERSSLRRTSALPAVSRKTLGLVSPKVRSSTVVTSEASDDLRREIQAAVLMNREGARQSDLYKMLLRLFEAYDSNGNGDIDIDEFMQAQLILQPEKQALASFLKADWEKEGSIRFDAFKRWQVREMKGLAPHELVPHMQLKLDKIQGVHVEKQVVPLSRSRPSVKFPAIQTASSSLPNLRGLSAMSAPSTEGGELRGTSRHGSKGRPVLDRVASALEEDLCSRPSSSATTVRKALVLRQGSDLLSEVDLESNPDETNRPVVQRSPSRKPSKAATGRSASKSKPPPDAPLQRMSSKLPSHVRILVKEET